MDLPKNITQIGETDHRCKIYVEDYVVSYMKQLNQLARDKDMAVALFGVSKQENDVAYLFLYGACKLDFLQRETRHLSQAQQQEIEKYRKKYFPEYTFLGYRLLNGEMIEGFHVCEQSICRYIAGYAQFYEKNDSMLAYMLDVREEAKPEVLDQQKYETVKKKQEERRTQHEEINAQRITQVKASKSLRGMRVAVFLVFAILCVAGLTSMNGEGDLEDLQVMARQVIGSVTEQRIPDAAPGAEAESQVDTLIAEDKLTEALLQENQEIQEEKMPVETEEMISVEETAEEETAAEETMESKETVEVAETVEVVDTQPASYVISEGDTLIAISVRTYGNDGRVSDICALNQIKNPDDIKVGQKILLP